MTTAQMMEPTGLERRSILLSGADAMGAMAEQGFNLAQLNLIPGGKFVSATVQPLELNNDPTTASVIAVQMQATSELPAQNVTPTADPEMQQRLRLLSALQAYARNDPALARDPQFWAAMAGAGRGVALSPAQLRVLRGAWAKRARSLATPAAAKRAVAQAHRTFQRAFPLAATFRQNAALTTMPAPVTTTYGREVTLGENFEEKLFNQMKPPVHGVVHDATHEPKLETKPEPKPEHKKRLRHDMSHRRSMKTLDHEMVTAELKRPVFKPKLGPSPTDTDSGDE